MFSAVSARRSFLLVPSNGSGSPEQVVGEVFKKQIAADIRHMPFNGAGPARKALLAGSVSMMFDPCKGAMTAIRQGQLKALAVANPTRVKELPSVPTFAEHGIDMIAPGGELRVWTGILAPRGTDAEVVAKLNAAILKILASPEIRKEIEGEVGESKLTTPSEFRAYIEADRERWAKVVRESGVPKVDKPI